MGDSVLRPSVLLKTASILAAIQGVAHTRLLLTYVPTHGPAESAVVAAMQGTRFDFGGFAAHSYWEMYLGYGLFAAFTCAIEAILFWQMARSADRLVIAVFCLANVGYAILVAMFFFRIPLFFDLAIAACLGLSLRARPATILERENKASLQAE